MRTFYLLTLALVGLWVAILYGLGVDAGLW